MLSSAFRGLNRPYSGSLRRAKNITREGLRQNADWSQQRGLAQSSRVCSGLGTNSYYSVHGLSATLTLELLHVCPSAIANTPANLRTREDSYGNLNGGRGTRGQVDVPPPPTEPEMTQKRYVRLQQR